MILHLKIKELHYILPVVNLESVLKSGIWCHNKAKQYETKTFANLEIQARRAKVKLTNGLPLHDHVNLYFTARNPMLYSILDKISEICVLKIAPEVLELENVFISDINASALYVKFGQYPDFIKEINWDYVFAPYWTDPDSKVSYQKKLAKCAEVLLPYNLASKYINGVYTHSKIDSQILKCIHIQQIPNNDLFFLA